MKTENWAMHVPRAAGVGGSWLLAVALASGALGQTPPGGLSPPAHRAPACVELPARGVAPSPHPTTTAHASRPSGAGAIDAMPSTRQPIAWTAARQPVGGPDLSPVYPPRAAQEAPRPLEFDSPFDRQSDPIPEYVYDRSYYDNYYRDVHQLADYAPPGYEVRDYQSAPGDPEYRRITPPVRVSQEDRERFVVGGMVPGSFLAPGTNTSVRLRGFVRLAALSDLQPIGVRDAFVVNSIPAPQTVGQNFNVSGRISRFALETWTPTTWCDRTIHTFIEGDFFNGPDQAAGGWNASYEHWFNAYWLTNLTYSQVSVDSRANQPATTYDAGQYVAASLWWIPITRLSLGMEYLWGERENLNGQSAKAQRIHWLAQYNF